jgi:hypothetical protein
MQVSNVFFDFDDERPSGSRVIAESAHGSKSLLRDWNQELLDAAECVVNE